MIYIIEVGNFRGQFSGESTTTIERKVGDSWQPLVTDLTEQDAIDLAEILLAMLELANAELKKQLDH